MVSEGARRAFSYRGAGKVRRRIRRLVRSRFFNNARTATRNLDLPLAIDDPHLLTAPPTASADSGQCLAATTAGFFGIRRCAGGLFIWAAILGTERGHGFLRTRMSPAISANI